MRLLLQWVAFSTLFNVTIFAGHFDNFNSRRENRTYVRVPYVYPVYYTVAVINGVPTYIPYVPQYYVPMSVLPVQHVPQAYARQNPVVPYSRQISNRSKKVVQRDTVPITPLIQAQKTEPSENIQEEPQEIKKAVASTSSLPNKKTWVQIVKSAPPKKVVLPPEELAESVIVPAPVEIVESKPTKSSRSKINFEKLDAEAKNFLAERVLLDEDKLENFLYMQKNDQVVLNWLRKANGFRHSLNEDTRLLAERILELIVQVPDLDHSLEALAYIYLGKIASHRQDFHGAIEIFNKGINRCGPKARLYYFIGNNYAYLNDEGKAIKNWKMAHELARSDEPITTIKVFYRLANTEGFHKNDKELLSNLLHETLIWINDTCNVASFSKNDSPELKDVHNIYFGSLIHFAELMEKDEALREIKIAASIFQQEGMIPLVIGFLNASAEALGTPGINEVPTL